MNETVLDTQSSPAHLLSLDSDSSSLEQHAFQQVPLTGPQHVRSLIRLVIEHFDWTSFLSTLALCAAVYVGCLVVYRLYLAPVAVIPGPFWAKVSSWYEFYYDYVHVGKYYERIREMHDKYGGPHFHLAPKNMILAASIILTHIERPHCARHSRRGSHPRSPHVPQAFRLSGREKDGWLRQILGWHGLRRYELLVNYRANS